MTSRNTEQWETSFRSWAGGPGDTEIERCENAERMIWKAIAASPELENLNIEIFAQGSFKNLTNIAQESDVDVCVCLKDAMYYEIPEGTQASDFGIRPTHHNYDTYRENVTSALTDYFGDSDSKVTSGNKAILIHSNSYRVNADVVPCWEFREYYDVTRPMLFRSGIKFFSGDGRSITNYPKQHIENGIAKNALTQKRFKRIARVLKSLQVEMIDERVLSKKLPSYLIESLVYNVPDGLFGTSSYRGDVENILAEIFNKTLPSGDCSKWFEVNGIKFLFHPTQPWSKEEAHAFANAAWNYLEFD